MHSSGSHSLNQNLRSFLSTRTSPGKQSLTAASQMSVSLLRHRPHYWVIVVQQPECQLNAVSLLLFSEENLSVFLEV